MMIAASQGLKTVQFLGGFVHKNLHSLWVMMGEAGQLKAKIAYIKLVNGERRLIPISIQ